MAGYTMKCSNGSITRNKKSVRMENSRTEISSLGEFRLIRHLTKNIELQNASSIVGVGDDAAIIDHFCVFVRIRHIPDHAYLFIQHQLFVF